MKTTASIIILVIVAALSPLYALADSDHDHDRARAALVAGEILPLPDILERVAKDHPGNVLEVELDRERGRWIYELKILQSGGGLLKLDVDAKDGAVIDRRERKR